MFIRKKKKNLFVELFLLLEPVSKILLSVGCFLVSMVYINVIVILIAQDYIFPDAQTAYYWGEQFFMLGKELLGAFFVPVLLYELLLCGLGLKLDHKK